MIGVEKMHEEDSETVFALKKSKAFLEQVREDLKNKN